MSGRFGKLSLDEQLHRQADDAPGWVMRAGRTTGDSINPFKNFREEREAKSSRIAAERRALAEYAAQKDAAERKKKELEEARKNRKKPSIGKRMLNAINPMAHFRAEREQRSRALAAQREASEYRRTQEQNKFLKDMSRYHQGPLRGTLHARTTKK